MPLTFTYLSAHDADGRPARVNLGPDDEATFDPPSAALLAEIDATLVQSRVLETHPDWLRSAALITTTPGPVTLTFITEAAGYKNGLSYYVFDPADPPTRFADLEELFVAFPNFSASGGGGTCQPGDTMTLAYRATATTDHPSDPQARVATALDYTFPAGTGIAFVLHANKWKSHLQRLQTGHSMFSSDPVLNPEPTAALQHHFVNFQSQEAPEALIFGVEDILRTKAKCDHDFNDMIFQVNPASRVAPRCYNRVEQRPFCGTIVCEDLLEKSRCDLDYNDLVLEYEVLETLTADDRVQGLTFEAKVFYRGASLDHDFGVVLPGLKALDARIFQEQFVAETGAASHLHLTGDNAAQGTDRVPIIRSTKACLKGTAWATNTLAADAAEVKPSYARLRIDFGEAGVSRAALGGLTFPYRFYLRTYRGARYMWDIYSDRLYDDVSADLVARGLTQKPKILVLPGVSGLRLPLERQPLGRCYFRLHDFLLGDQKYARWTALKWARQHLLAAPVAEPVVDHPWSPWLAATAPSGQAGLVALPDPQALTAEVLLAAHGLDTKAHARWDWSAPVAPATALALVRAYGPLTVADADRAGPWRLVEADGALALEAGAGACALFV